MEEKIEQIVDRYKRHLKYLTVIDWLLAPADAILCFCFAGMVVLKEQYPQAPLLLPLAMAFLLISVPVLTSGMYMKRLKKDIYREGKKIRDALETYGSLERENPDWLKRQMLMDMVEEEKTRQADRRNFWVNVWLSIASLIIGALIGHFWR